MPVILARAVFPDVNGITADEAVNDFTFDTVLSLSTIAANVITFYNGVGGSPSNPCQHLGTSRDRGTNRCQVELYDISAHLDGSPHGSPVDIVMWTLGTPGSTQVLPRQAAITVTNHAVFGSVLEHGPTVTRPSTESAIDQGAPATHAVKSRPKASLRGRIQVGPLSGFAANLTTGLVSAEANLAFASACNGLLAADPGWSVWSRVNATTHPISGGWIDQDFAVIRRRKLKSPTPKVVWA